MAYDPHVYSATGGACRVLAELDLDHEGMGFVPYPAKVPVGPVHMANVRTRPPDPARWSSRMVDRQLEIESEREGMEEPAAQRTPVVVGKHVSETGAYNRREWVNDPFYGWRTQDTSKIAMVRASETPVFRQAQPRTLDRLEHVSERRSPEVVERILAASFSGGVARAPRAESVAHNFSDSANTLAVVGVSRPLVDQVPHSPRPGHAAWGGNGQRSHERLSKEQASGRDAVDWVPPLQREHRQRHHGCLSCW
uniref:Uncharacterized protein n=1 Tax=Noctiluca scintillans TaxID=2966 RepID=A0A7S0ZRB4_NOCSC|mmetsp:Transcript_1469/g.3994  ORF Transcript_1469/g.3994 Transcript_1469/m.3994 type:complete len:252 (+) Transcript_1469:90-845(+)